MISDAHMSYNYGERAVHLVLEAVIRLAIGFFHEHEAALIPGLAECSI